MVRFPLEKESKKALRGHVSQGLMSLYRYSSWQVGACVAKESLISLGSQRKLHPLGFSPLTRMHSGQRTFRKYQDTHCLEENCQ
jgi:hypothetical protein